MMGVNVIEAERLARKRLKKLVIIGTICSYPKHTPVPFKEDDLWNGYPEETNAPYGLAKKLHLVMLNSYRHQYGTNGIYLMPVNLFGPRDCFEEERSHVIPALIKRFENAYKNKEEEIVVWGTGNASREFLYVKDCARGIRLATEQYNNSTPVNIGSGSEVKISELVNTLSRLYEVKYGFKIPITWDKTKPDGQPRRCLDTTRAKEFFDFEAQIDLESGLKKTIIWYNQEK